MVVISDSEHDKCGFPKLVLEWIFNKCIGMIWLLDWVTLNILIIIWG